MISLKETAVFDLSHWKCIEFIREIWCPRLFAITKFHSKYGIQWLRYLPISDPLVDAFRFFLVPSLLNYANILLSKTFWCKISVMNLPIIVSHFEDNKFIKTVWIRGVKRIKKTATAWLKKKSGWRIIYECRSLNRRFYRILLEINFQIKPSKQTRLKMTNKRLLIKKTCFNLKRIRERQSKRERQSERKNCSQPNHLLCWLNANLPMFFLHTYTQHTLVKWK